MTSPTRETLGKQMDEIFAEHEQLLQIIIERQLQSNQHPLVKQINEWEQQSIEKIRRVAENTRQQLFSLIKNDTIKISNDAENLREQLNKARATKDYTETELKLWFDKLKTLKTDLCRMKIINIQSDNQPIVFNTCITKGPKDLFEDFIGDMLIEDNGQVITHGPTTQYTSIRCQNEYSFDTHRLQFKIENLNVWKQFYLGTVSKNISLQLISQETPTTYGWSSYNNVSLNGISHMGYNGYRTDLEINDIIELVIDCNQKKIRMINQTTNCTHGLSVDILQCPFPWKINLGLYYKDDRIRILPTS